MNWLVSHGTPERTAMNTFQRVRCGRMMAIGAAMLALGAARASGDFFPIIDGHEWRYEVEDWYPELEHYSAAFDGVEEVNGHLTHVLRSTHDGYVQENYWSQDGSGDVFEHFHQFDVPIRMLDVPLFVGKTWSTTVQTASGPVVFLSRVESFGPVTVPAGTFDCFLIARFSDGIFYAAEYYAENIGLVTRAVHDPWSVERLMTLPGPVAVEPTTWSQVRQLYR